MSTALVTLTASLAKRLDMENSTGLIETLKATAFKGQVSDAQMTALLIVANQYGLNPWTKEIYAFPDKQNGIVPVVGVDGWARIINTNSMFDGMEFKQDDDSCTCVIYRKDRGHPISITEYMSECRRAVGPWQSHPKRMLRHKAMIQCARLAFGFGGIYDQDEAERIVEAKAVSGETIDNETGEIDKKPNPVPWSQAKFKTVFDKFSGVISAGTKSAADLIKWMEGTGPLSQEQKDQILGLEKKFKPIAGDVMTAAEISEAEARDIAEGVAA